MVEHRKSSAALICGAATVADVAAGGESEQRERRKYRRDGADQLRPVLHFFLLLFATRHVLSLAYFRFSARASLVSPLLVSTSSYPPSGRCGPSNPLGYRRPQ